MDMNFSIGQDVTFGFEMGGANPEIRDTMDPPLQIIPPEALPVCGESNAGGGCFVNF